MADAFDTEVIVVGAGPVGITAAMDLAWRGIDVTVVERRREGEAPAVKCNHTAARSMEIFRRLGVAKQLRDSGLPPDYPNDVAYRTTTTGFELTRIRIPCRRDRYTSTDGPDTSWPTPEPPHRINQIFLEPILVGHAVQMPHLTLRSQTEFLHYEQDLDGVTVHAQDVDDGTHFTIRAKYLIGCEGGRSKIRTAIGAQFQGEPVIQRVQSTFIRAPALATLVADRPAWSTASLNPRRSGNVYAIDGRETWLIHNYLRPTETDFDSVDRDWSIRTILGVGDDFEYEVLSNEDWIGRRLVADKFRDRRVFISGDAAHIWVPYAGYGMNAGIADATNLSWMLAAHLHGWAPEAILDAHERERLPITQQVSFFAMNHAEQMIKQRGGVPPTIEDAGPEGDAARAALGRQAYDLNVQQYCAGGLNFGSFYDNSPIIAYDSDKPPSYSMMEFTSSTVPGCRTPHFWMSDGRSLYDAMGPYYTLLRFDPSIDVAHLVWAAAKRHLPLDVLDVDPGDAGPVYGEKLVLSRPDQHVAWRGDELPADALELVDLIRGAARDPHQQA